jgi:Protein of unknown function (DUF1569)
MKTLKNLNERQTIALRLSQLSPEDTARWGSMTVHQMICHLVDSYKVPLGEKTASPATSFLQRTVVKWAALKAPTRWPHGVPTRPEIEQGKGGSAPVDFRQDLASLLSTLRRFCDDLANPCLPHPIFGKMTSDDWMRWGYLHADHHLRQFGR